MFLTACLPFFPNKTDKTSNICLIILIRSNITIIKKIFIFKFFRYKRLATLQPSKVIMVIFAISCFLGFCIQLSYKTIEIKQIFITNNTIKSYYIYKNVLDFDYPFFVYISTFATIISNKLFLIILIFINTLLYVELRKIMRKKQDLVKK